MAIRDLPGVFEQLVLLALARLKDDAYGMAVQREIEKRGARRAALGAVYATLDRLESKGYVRSHASRASSERGSRPKRFFRLEPAGEEALRQSLEILDRMRRGLRRRL